MDRGIGRSLRTDVLLGPGVCFGTHQAGKLDPGSTDRSWSPWDLRSRRRNKRVLRSSQMVIPSLRTHHRTGRHGSGCLSRRGIHHADAWATELLRVRTTGAVHGERVRPGRHRMGQILQARLEETTGAIPQLIPCFTVEPRSLERGSSFLREFTQKDFCELLFWLRGQLLAERQDSLWLLRSWLLPC